MEEATLLGCSLLQICIYVLNSYLDFIGACYIFTQGVLQQNKTVDEDDWYYNVYFLWYHC